MVQAEVILPLLALQVMQAAPEDDWPEDWEEPQTSSEVQLGFHGFAEAAGAPRLLDDDAALRRTIMAEGRFRLDASAVTEVIDLKSKVDLVFDAALSKITLDVRELVALWRALDWLELRVGRQVLTWGTGDLLFLNDLFPKDFVSFFIGRDDQFLKAPGNAVKVSIFTSALNLDLVWHPIFSPDRSIAGRRISFFNPMAGARVGPRAYARAPFGVVAVEPKPQNGEFAARLYRNIKGFELALYGYLGFTKQPLAFNFDALAPTFSRQTTVGASARGALLGGIVYAEGALDWALDDASGDNPAVPNSIAKGLVGYERELVKNLTIGAQYYLEWILRADEEVEAQRHLVTLRLMLNVLSQTLRISLFGFLEPQALDAHARVAVHYQLSDAIALVAGANLMFGKEDGFFGQLKENSNVFARARYSF